MPPKLAGRAVGPLMSPPCTFWGLLILIDILAGGASDPFCGPPLVLLNKAGPPGLAAFGHYTKACAVYQTS